MSALTNFNRDGLQGFVTFHSNSPPAWVEGAGGSADPPAPSCSRNRCRSVYAPLRCFRRLTHFLTSHASKRRSGASPNLSRCSAQIGPAIRLAIEVQLEG